MGALHVQHDKQLLQLLTGNSPSSRHIVGECDLVVTKYSIKFSLNL